MTVEGRGCIASVKMKALGEQIVSALPDEEFLQPGAGCTPQMGILGSWQLGTGWGRRWGWSGPVMKTTTSWTWAVPNLFVQG